MNNQPYLIEVDPKRIKFRADNPRGEHRENDPDFVRLKENIKQVGMVQLPTLRTLPGGFYETIAGERRVRVALANKQTSIWAVNFGIVDDEKASLMMMSENMMRSFSFLAECRGYADLHRKGFTTRRIAREFGDSTGLVGVKVGVGYLPNDILSAIEQNINTTGDTNPWILRMFEELLPLRQEVQDPRHADILDGVYDYTEFRHVVDKIINGEIRNSVECKAYVAQRRLEILEKQFDADLQVRLDQELSDSKAVLEAAYEQQLETQRIQIEGEKSQLAKQLEQQYNTQLQALEQQVGILQRQVESLQRDAVKRPERLVQREEELQKQLGDIQQLRIELQRTQQSLQSEYANKKKELENQQELLIQQQAKELEVIRAQIRQQEKSVADKRREQLEAEFALARHDLEKYVQKREEELRLKAEKSVSQAVAHAKQLMAEVEQSVLLVASRDFLRGLQWLNEFEIVSLLAQIRSTQDVLARAEATIRRGEPEEGEVVDVK